MSGGLLAHALAREIGHSVSPQQAKALYKILEQNVVNYEQAFGEIKLDARNTTPPRPLN